MNFSLEAKATPPISPFSFLSFPSPPPLSTLYCPPCQAATKIQHFGRAVSQTIAKISWRFLPSLAPSSPPPFLHFSPFPHYPFPFPFPFLSSFLPLPSPFPFSQFEREAVSAAGDESDNAKVSRLIQRLMRGYDKRLRPNYKGRPMRF